MIQGGCPFPLTLSSISQAFSQSSPTSSPSPPSLTLPLFLPPYLHPPSLFVTFFALPLPHLYRLPSFSPLSPSLFLTFIALPLSHLYRPPSFSPLSPSLFLAFIALVVGHVVHDAGLLPVLQHLVPLPSLSSSLPPSPPPSLPPSFSSPSLFLTFIALVVRHVVHGAGLLPVLHHLVPLPSLSSSLPLSPPPSLAPSFSSPSLFLTFIALVVGHVVHGAGLLPVLHHLVLAEPQQFAQHVGVASGLLELLVLLLRQQRRFLDQTPAFRAHVCLDDLHYVTDKGEIF